MAEEIARAAPRRWPQRPGRALRAETTLADGRRSSSGRVRYFSRFLEEVEAFEEEALCVKRLPADPRSAEAQGPRGGHRSRHHQLAGGGGDRRQAAVPAGGRGRRAAAALGGALREATARSSSGARAMALLPEFPHRHHQVGEALHGQSRWRPRDAQARRATSSPRATGRGALRGGGRPAGDAHRGVGRDPARAQAPRRVVLRRQGRAGGDHRAGLLRRRPAAGHQGRRAAGGPRGAAAAQRAHRGGAGLRPRQGQPGPLRGLRPGRRHLRHLDPQARSTASSR